MLLIVLTLGLVVGGLWETGDDFGAITDLAMRALLMGSVIQILMGTCSLNTTFSLL